MSSPMEQRQSGGTVTDATTRPVNTYIHNTRSTYSRKTTHSHRKIPRNQRTIFQYLSHEQQQHYTNEMHTINDDWGNTYKTKDSDSIRIWLSNPNGLGLNPNNSKSHNAFEFPKKKSQSDITNLVETNLRWPDLSPNATLNSRVRTSFHQFQTVTSYNKHENLGKVQRGGTCTIATGQTSYRVTKLGTDSTGLGRWSWLQFSGRGAHRTRVISAYRPCQRSSNSKLTTVWYQQHRYFKKEGQHRDPREMFLIDLEALIIQWLQDGIHIVLCIDANDDLQSGQFFDVTRRLGLINTCDPYGNIRIPATHIMVELNLSRVFSFLLDYNWYKQVCWRMEMAWRAIIGMYLQIFRNKALWELNYSLCSTLNAGD